MKAFLKRCFAVILAASLCLVLCSCIDVKDMRKTHGVYADEAKTEIIFNNTRYRLISQWPEDTEIMLWDMGTVAEKDVPILLASICGNYMEYNADKEILRVDYSIYYCRTDIYDEVINILEKQEFNYLCYSFYNEETGSYDSELLSSEMSDAIKEIMSTQQPKKDYPEVESYVSVYRCDKNMLFQNRYVDINRSYDDEYFLNIENDEWETIIYKIPDDKISMFKNFLDTYSEGFYAW